MNGHVTGIASEPGYTVVENASLEGRNTFRVPARTELLIDVSAPEVLPSLFALAALKSDDVLILGEGSNVLFTRNWPGVVLSISTTGIRVLENRSDSALVRVAAGENWNDFVRWSLAHNFMGLENLSLIPGTVGAAPIQNIGAYGVEVCEFINRVEVFDRKKKTLEQLSNADCAFAYRDSVFKRAPDRHIVTAVEFVLPHNYELKLDYAGVREDLAMMQIEIPTAIAVAEAVCRLRTRKLPNPALIGNAGSFFKNPIVPADLADILRDQNPTLPIWSTGNNDRKLSAAWLVEACNFKGLREGDAGVSSQHALVLVNHGHATGEQIWRLAEKIREAVSARFGVNLEPEPKVI
jgi:UDP-N-acetylmuramate dehydrogenase